MPFPTAISCAMVMEIHKNTPRKWGNNRNMTRIEFSKIIDSRRGFKTFGLNVRKTPHDDIKGRATMYH